MFDQYILAYFYSTLAIVFSSEPYLIGDCIIEFTN